MIKVFERLFGAKEDNGGYEQAPLGFQLDILGLGKERIKNLEGKKVLDIGCGNGTLVEHLRSKGIEAEGIDYYAPKGQKHFIAQGIGNMHQEDGPIPRDDTTYDLILAFQLSILNTAFIDTKQSWIDTYEEQGKTKREACEYVAKICQEGNYILSEIGRTLKQNASAIIYPAITRANSEASTVIQRNTLSLSHEMIEPRITRAYMNEKMNTQETCPVYKTSSHKTHISKR